MNRTALLLFLILSVSVLSLESAYGQPLQEVTADVLTFDGTYAAIEISWNPNNASYYESGCVSCIPNFSDTTANNSIILNNVTSFADGNALLYVLAYDDNDEVISAKQVMIHLQ